MENEKITSILRADGREVKDSDLLQPILHLMSAPRESILCNIIQAFNHWLRVPEETVEKVLYLCELLNETLHIVDDIEDGSERRRGQPAAHIVHGIPLTINCANYVQSIVFEHVLALDHPKAMHVLVEHLHGVYRAIGKDIYWRETLQCPLEQEYIQEIMAEALPWYHLPVRMLKLFSKDERNLDNLLDLFALFSVVHTDYLNLTSDTFSNRKGFCGDLTEGKYGFPTVHAIRTSNRPEGELVAAILKQRTNDENLKRYCVLLMEKTGSFAYTREKLNNLQKEIEEEIAKLGGNPLLEVFLLKLETLETAQ